MASPAARAAEAREAHAAPAAPAPSARAWILRVANAPAPRAFGLTGEDRLRRTLTQIGVTEVDAGATPPRGFGDGAPILILRDDCVVDPRLVAALRAAPGTLLLAPDAPRDPIAACAAGDAADAAAEALRGRIPAADVPLRAVAPDRLVAPWNATLRKRDPAYVLRLAAGDEAEAERRLFAASYKGLTDVVTRHVWPAPALRVVRVLARAGVTPNQVTAASYALVALATWLFFTGAHGAGLAAAWLMTFLDTVDGKLARVTLRTSRIGGALDHGLDLVHPPIWWWAFGASLLDAAPWVEPALAVVLVGYVAGRALEGLFLLAFGFEVHCWRPIDAAFRGVVARRNPNLVLLSVSTLAGHPALGLAAVAVWTAIGIAFHALRLLAAGIERLRGHAIEPFGDAPEGEAGPVLALGIALSLALWAAPVLAAPSPGGAPPAPPPSRLGPGEFASESFELVARFDSGHRLFVEIVLTNVGLGDANAAVIGHVIEPDGSVQRFRKARADGDWTRSPDGLRIAIGSTVLDRSPASGRFAMDRTRVAMELRLAPGPAPVAWDEVGEPGFGIELLQATGAIEGTLRTERTTKPLQVRGSVALLHRWTDTLESRRAARRIELFAPEDARGLFVAELAQEGGPARRWIVRQEIGGATLRWSERAAESRTGGALSAPAQLRLSAPGLAGEVTLATPLVRFDPLEELPAVIRAALRLVLHAEDGWSPATFALDFAPSPDATPESVAGNGFAHVTFFRPPEDTTASALPAAYGRIACASAY